mgnify:CR=1 FL=1
MCRSTKDQDVAPREVRIVILHGTADTIVPLDQLPVLDDPASNPHLLDTLASARGGDDVAEPLPSESAAENPSEQVAPMGNDLFDMAVEQPRNDDVDADNGVTGSSHE